MLLWKKERLSRVLRQRTMEDSLTYLYNAAAYRKLVTEKLRKLTPDRLGAFLITVGIGAVLAKKTDSYDKLYRMADQTLYKAKCDQRDQFYIAKRPD